MDTIVGPSSFPVTVAGALGIPSFHYTAPHGWTKLGTDHLPWFPSIRCYSIAPSTDKAKLADEIA